METTIIKPDHILQNLEENNEENLVNEYQKYEDWLELETKIISKTKQIEDLFDNIKIEEKSPYVIKNSR